MLVLSQFAGAAQQLRAAVLVNPLRIDHCAEAIAGALRMPPVEQMKRMRILRDNVASFDASWWATQMVEDVSRAGTGPVRRELAERTWSSAVA